MDADTRPRVDLSVLSSASISFAAFQASAPARSMFDKLDLLDYLEQATSWRALRAMIVHFNDPDVGRFVKLVRQCDGVCSSGERILLHAIATVCDFAWLADKLSHGRSWQDMGRASGAHLRAVAACIAALDQV